MNIDIFNKIFNCYVKNKYKNLSKIFYDVLYYLSTYSYSTIQQDFIFNCMNICNTNIIYNKIIRNHLLSLNKKPLRTKENQINNQKNEKFFVENIIDEKDYNSFDHSLFSFMNNTNNISFLNHLNLFSYIINSSFSIKKSSDNIINIHFYPKLLNKILILLNNLSLENSNKKLFEEVLMFLLNLVSVLINLYFSENDLVFKENYLIDSFLKIIEKSSIDNKYLIIFPSLINIIKTTFLYEFPNNNISNDDKLYNFIFDYLISNFSYNDSSGIINIQQNILLFKSLIILFADKNSSQLQKKFFSLDKLIDLILKSNNEKLIDSFLKFCEELLKNKEKDNINLSQYSMNKYSKFINDYINESFIEFISEKFKESIMQKRPNNIEYNDDIYFIINTISNIYNNLCIKYKKISNDKLKSFNELIEEFCRSKLIIGVCDSLFVSIERNECDMINIIKNEDNIFTKYDELNEKIEKLDYYIYIYDNYFDKNIQNNKISMCHYGILKSLAHLLSGYLSNSIYIFLKQEEENDDKQEENIINLLDYINTRILLNETLKNTTYPVFFLNCIFSNEYILNYFFIHYSNYCINQKREENEQITLIQEMFTKSNAFLNYIRQNHFFIIFMKDIINSLIEFDSLFIGKKHSLINNEKNSVKLYETKNIINNLIRSEEKWISEYNDNFKVMINSFFTKIFLDEIFEKNNQIKSFQNKQIIFLFLLDNSLLEKYINLFGYLINMDYTLIQIYSFLRIKTLSPELNEKIIIFINKHIAIENFGNFKMGIINNVKIFKSFYKDKCINVNYIYNLFNVTKIIINNFINSIEYNNINEKLLNLFDKIIEYINNFYKINHDHASLEFYLFGKIISESINNLNQKMIQSQNENNTTEQNSKTSDKISQINSIIESIHSLIMPKYFKCIFNIIKCIEKTNLDFEYSLDNAFLSFFLCLDIISSIIDNKYYQMLSSNIDSNLLDFFKEFICFNQNNNYLIDLNYFTLFYEKYIKLREDHSKKIFLEYLYLFSLFKGKQDEKNLKSVVIEFFGEFEDKQTKEDFTKYGYITCYFLSSIKKDSSGGNKNKNNVIVNPEDISIIKRIGERFKDDEKSLQKNNNPNVSTKI